jgi:hypothetical protein
MLLSTSSAVGGSRCGEKRLDAFASAVARKRAFDLPCRIRLDARLAQRREITGTALHREIERQRRADHRDAAMTEADEPPHGVARAASLSKSNHA